MQDIDVLIVGAGPTGLMLALELAVHEIPFRIIDSIPTRSDKSRAFALHSRTIELLNRHGVAQEFIDRGKFNPAVRIYANQRFVFENDFNSLAFEDTMYQNPLVISQAEIESIFDEVLLEKGVEVERPVTAETVLQDDEGVTAILRLGNGNEEVLRCKYIVGCDGPRSIVRKSAGLIFEGEAYLQEFILADLHMEWEAKECLHILWGLGFMVAFPMKDNLWRLVCARDHQQDVNIEPKLEDFQRMMDRLLPSPVKLSDSVWISRFKLHHRIANSYRAGRMFLAGDAAHVHSPAGGQGMNTGIHDSVNLGWKLATVLKGNSNEDLLDSYNIERRRIGQILLQGTDKMFEFLATSNPFYLFVRNYIMPFFMPWIMMIPGQRARAYRFISELGIRYRQSPIVGQAMIWKGALKGGDRVPDGRLLKGATDITVHSLLRACGHTLLLFSGLGSGIAGINDLENAEELILKEIDQSLPVYKIMSTTSKDADIVDSEGQVHKLYGFGGVAGFVLVRPDGHIEFIGPLTALEELLAWTQGRD